MAVTGHELQGKPSATDKAAERRSFGTLLAGVNKRLRIAWRPVGRFFGAIMFSSLAQRIIVLNLAGLAVLVLGILFLNQWRTGLIDARLQSLRVQGEIIASAIAASATVDSDVITVNPDRLVELQTGDAVSSFSFFDPALEFPINPERVAPLLRNLVTPTRTRARIYDKEGLLILDSANLYARGEVLRSLAKPQDGTGFFLFDWWNTLMAWLPGDDFPQYQEYGADEGTRYPEVASALTGAASAIVRVDAKHQLVVSVAVPVQRVRATVGVLLLSTTPGEIDQIDTAERWGILRIALVAAAVTIILSLLLAGTIAGPLRRLAGAAERVQNSATMRAEIPDFSDRADEVGHLSRALRSMTSALYNRIEAIERFAADVAHELKNPLTSLRSAVETLPIAKTETSRERLLSIIQHDVKRLDRLITDISDASRLDAELARADNHDVDLVQILEAVVAVANGMSKNQVRVRLTVAPAARGDDDPTLYSVMGYDSRLGQVFNNLIDNARSFSQEGGSVRVDLRPKLGGAGPQKRGYEVVVDDDGPGIPADAFERIFERFYTDRPNQGFGQNSGLGLSISRQIVEAHGGKIVAENRTKAREAGEDAGAVLGARFTVWLPAACDAR